MIRALGLVMVNNDVGEPQQTNELAHRCADLDWRSALILRDIRTVVQRACFLRKSRAVRCRYHFASRLPP
jgi:hypothetical protein